MMFDNSPLYYVESTFDGKRYSLYDLAKWKNGLAFKKIDFSDNGGIPVIKIAELNNGLGSTTAYTKGVYNDEVYLEFGDFLFSWSGNPQTSIDIFRFQLKNGWLNQHIFKVTPDESVIYKEFFFYVMKWLKPNFTDIATNKQTTGLGHVTISDLKRLSVVIPDMELQRKIGDFLHSVDRKIALNTAINENLEQQAYLLLEQMLSIPHDDVCCLSDIANINPHYTLSKGTEARYIDMSQLSTTTSFPDGWTFRPYNGGMKFKNKDTIMARITPCLENGKTAYIDFLEGEEIAFGSTEYIVLSPKDNIPPELLYCIVRYPEFRTYATINMNGSSGRQRVSGEIIGKYEMPSFTQEELSEFGAVAEPLFKQITENSLQNRNLSALRDTLLPKLMNGEIDVSAVKI